MSTSPLALPDIDRTRAALVARRERVRVTWAAQDGWGDTLVVVPGGLQIDVEGSDQRHAFRAHDDHVYLTGCRTPAQVLVFDAEEGWILFAYVPSQEDRVWHGEGVSLEDVAATSGVDRALPIGAFAVWLHERAGRSAALLGSRDILERPIGYELHPGDLEALAFDADLTQRLETSLHDARAVKDDVELDFMRAAALCSRAGHLAALERARPGGTERALQVEIETALLRAGADRPAYDTIAASGSNAAILHATPGGRGLAEGDLVLVDAGAEVAGYDSDVTRTWPVSATFTAEQRALYDICLDVQRTAIAHLAPGVEYRDLHMEAALGIAAGLVDFGLLRGRPEDLVEHDAHALFLPHGLGHLIGLATHDVGGWTPGRARSERPGLKFLRIDLPMRAGHVVTIEPGIYMVRALLTDPDLRRKHHEDVNWARADAMLEFGGIRIEDDVLVTEQGRDVLTAAIPKAPAEIEALRA